MKIVLTSILVVLLGAATGWHWEKDDLEQKPTIEKKSSPPAKPTANPTPEDLARSTRMLGTDWRSWAARIEKAETSEDLETVFTDLAGTEDSQLKISVHGLLAARWVEIDPAAGLAFLGGAEKGKKVFIPMLAEWFILDQNATLEAIANFDEPRGTYLHDSVLKRLVKLDPDATLDFMRITREHVHYPEYHRWVTLARARPREYADLITEIETENLKRGERYSAYSHIRIAAGVLASQDPESALIWADGLEGKVRDEAVRAVLRSWASKDPEMVVKKLAAWKESPGDSPFTSTKGLSLDDFTLARTFARKSTPDVAMNWLKENSYKSNTYFEAAAMEIARGDMSFEELFDAVKDVNSYGNRIRTTAYREMWDRMTNDELLGAFEVLKNKPTTGQRAKALGGLLRETMDRDPAAALELASRLPSNPERHEAIREMFRDTDLERRDRTAEAMIGSLPPEDAAFAIGALFEGKPRKPDSDILTFNANFYTETLSATPPSKARTQAVERLALHWSGFDPVAAMEWAENLPAEDAVGATAAAASGWAPHDAYSLSNHLVEMPAGPTRDAATAALVESVRETEPDSAWAWATSIDDPATGSDARHAVIKSWAAREPDEARAAVDSAKNLPSAERNTLRRVIEE